MKRNKFSLSHYKLLSMSQGELVPCGLVEVLPGDSIQHVTSALVRVTPLLAPMMHQIDCRIHHWFVPHRLVWDSWEDFITGGPDGEDDSAIPVISTPASVGFAVGSLADYLGVPTGVASRQISALPFRGYALIWNEWYRDQDLQNELVISKADSLDTTTSVDLQNVAWEKDYFTSSRPWPQKGPDVVIPFSGNVPVITTGVTPTFTNGTNTAALRGTSGVGTTIWSNNPTVTANFRFDTPTGLQVDMSQVQGIEVNDLREAMALQRFQEARARYGSRYTEYLRYLGVRSSDARLQRPEYLGGGRNTLQISEVLQTAPNATGGTSGTAGVGDLAGHGIGALRSNRYRRFFEEHGYIFTFISVKPKTIYMQGLPKTWMRPTKEDYFQKELQHIGQQEVMCSEVYLAPASSQNTVFGYQDRYDEYRRMESSVSGEFRTTLNFWHMAREFSGGSNLTLNGSFVQSNPTNRVYADTTSDQLWIMANHSIQARRLLSPRGNSYIF